MIVNTALSASLAVAADKSVPQEGDDVTIIPSTIIPGEKLLSPHHVVVAATGAIARTSFISSFSKIRAASTALTADVIVTLVRGLWTIRWNMCSDVQLSAGVGSSPGISFLVAMENDTQNVGVQYGDSGAERFISGVFRLLLSQNADLRLDIRATVAGDAIQATVCLNGEKNI